MTPRDPIDPRGLMNDAFKIEGITASECRSIFLDWVLGVPADRDIRTEVAALVAQYASQSDPPHPMMITLTAALTDAKQPRRRGGRQSRISRLDSEP
jgi:hypothetical protein